VGDGLADEDGRGRSTRQALHGDNRILQFLIEQETDEQAG
jgi:hypothetical protein